MTQQFETQKVIFSYKSLKVDKSQLLGQGAYGAVYKAKCDQLPCAAEVLHPAILDPRDPGARKRFEKECTLLESIRHPHIVQYLGMTRDPESRLPVLLMELLDESLTKMLQCSQQSLAFHVQVDICHDIALAVAYLHLKEIIHRDLSSNNVLIIAGRRAKVTDFCTSKLAVADSTTTSLTTRPGTLAYMPPEALREPPMYTKKMDCFSEGVIMIQVCTRLWPEPGPRTKLAQDSRSPTGKSEMPILETDRRKNHIDLIDPKNALLPIATDCLHYQYSDRPSSEELCQRLADLKKSSEYRQSTQQSDETKDSKQVSELKRQIKEMQEREATNIQQQQDELQRKNDQILLQVKWLQEKDLTLREQRTKLQGELNSKERELQQLNSRLEEQEKLSVAIQQTNVSLQRQVKQLQQQLSQQTPQDSKSPPPVCAPKPSIKRRQSRDKKSTSSQPSLQVDNKPHPPKVVPRHTHTRLQLQNNDKPHLHVLRDETALALNWSNGERAPLQMVRGDAVMNGNIAYFMNYNGEVCSYDLATERWNKLLKGPYQGSSLAVVNTLLTSVGGFKGSIIRTPNNKLLSLSSDDDKGWTELLPPMPTRRCNTAAVTTEKHLIVAGGESGASYVQRHDTVEVMDIGMLVWSTVASFPHPYSSASVAVCGDDLYMLGGLDDNGESKSMLTCSITELLQSNSKSLSVWYRAADTANYYSTCAAVNGELLAVGGCGQGDKAVATIHNYNTTANSWNLVGNLPTARYQCLVAVPSTNEIIVVGGNEHFTPTDIVEITSI